VKPIKERDRRKKKTQKIQDNTILYRRQRLEEGRANIGSHSFPPFPFSSFSFIKYFPLANVKPPRIMRS